jgi:hypothetical protein
LLGDGSGLVVADNWNDWLCVFGLSGEVMATVGGQEQGLYGPWDVLECATDGSFIVANICSNNLVKLSRHGVKLGVYGKTSSGDGEFADSPGLAALPDGGMVVRDRHGTRLSILRDHCHRLEWIGACVSAALRQS